MHRMLGREGVSHRGFMACDSVLKRGGRGGTASKMMGWSILIVGRLGIN